MSFKRFDQEDVVVSAESVTSPVWTGDLVTLTGFWRQRPLPLKRLLKRLAQKPKNRLQRNRLPKKQLPKKQLQRKQPAKQGQRKKQPLKRRRLAS